MTTDYFACDGFGLVGRCRFGLGIKQFVVVLFCVVGMAQPAVAKDRPPNIVLIFADDLGYGDISCYNKNAAHTPNLDKLAEEGLRSTDFFVPANVCSPSRAALLTGRYPQRCGFPVARRQGKGSKYEDFGLLPDEVTIPELLNFAGYRSLMVGKWHLGFDCPGSHPLDAGFDEYLGIPHNYSSADGPAGKTLHEGKKPIQKNIAIEELTKRYTDKVVSFIDQRQDEPFFIYFAHHIVHGPHAPRKEFIGTSGKGKYGDFVKELDHSTGRIVEALEEAGVLGNTLVIFTSDNGAIPRHGSNGVMSAGKYSTMEGGHRVPAIFRMPGVIPAGKVLDTTLTSMDLLPIFCALAGVEVLADRTIDGRNTLPILKGESTATLHEVLYYYNGTNLQCVREGDWKLHLPRTAKDQPFWSQNPKAPGRGFVNLAEPKLFNLKDDLAEKRDLAKNNPEVVARLLKLAEAARAELGDVRVTGSDQRKINLVDPQQK